LLLAGLGAEVIKVEPPEGSPTRRIGPFLGDIEGAERSLHFWAYNRGKRSVVLDLSGPRGRDNLRGLLASADVFVESTPRGFLDELGLGADELASAFPALVLARMSPFGDVGPWAGYRGCDLVHLALGGVMANCGYDPLPDGTYDLPPIAPQSWHAYCVAGEQLAMGVVAALLFRRRTGRGQRVSCAVHEAVAKNTELDLMSWVMRRVPLFRQTCRHAAERVSPAPTITHTKDGRWVIMMGLGGRGGEAIASLLERYDMPSDLAVSGSAAEPGRPIPGSGHSTLADVRRGEAWGRLVRKFSYSGFPWQEAQAAGLLCAPLRKPHENVLDDHWWQRQTFSEVEHGELGRRFVYPTGKWVSTETAWVPGRRAPMLGEDTDALAAPGDARATALRAADRPQCAPSSAAGNSAMSARGMPFALEGIRILDFTWFLASAGATRFLSAFGAECLKVEWHEHPDTRLGAMAPVGGRAARDSATGPLPPVSDPDMGGQFNNKNPGKRGISLNVRDPRGLEIARRLVRVSDVVAEGFSPGVMDRWGLGYDALRELRPDVIYAAQSGMGARGNYGRLRAVGPIAAAMAGISETSGLPEPAMPAGWGYSYLDWLGAYSFALAILAALEYRGRTGKGQWIDASQTEAGIFASPVPILDWSANGRAAARTGNRSPYKPAAPHGAYRCAGADRWVAIACFDDDDFAALARVAGHGEWLVDRRFATLAARLENADALDAMVTRWTQTLDRYEAMTALQAAGVAAGVCQTAQDRCDSDPQLRALGWLTEVKGTKIGRWPVAEVPLAMSESPPYIGGVIDRAAPCYGEDNEYVLGELLGMSKAEIAELAEDGVI
jgi:crotonobetainyl-CoA:carnitine CoA-transferase CaiB-like acyl-CoA transferase